jgi:hypothetical protein
MAVLNILTGMQGLSRTDIVGAEYLIYSAHQGPGRCITTDKAFTGEFPVAAQNKPVNSDASLPFQWIIPYTPRRNQLLYLRPL